jgi:hypothetical protein
VTTTADSGPHSLRDAIAQINADVNPDGSSKLSFTNADPTRDEIDFAIPGSGMQTIRPATALPIITNPVVLNGGSQTAGFKANDLPNQGAGAGDDAVWTITLDGGQMPADGLTIAAGGSTVEGLVIQNFLQGIHLTTNGSDTLAGNSLKNNSAWDILVDDVPGNTIGGTAPAARNVLAGALGIVGAGATGNVLQGNYLGTDGSQVLAGSSYSSYAVQITDASNNTVGGTASGAGNVIASDAFAGIGLDSDTPVSGNVVQGNYVGLTADGTAVLPGLQGTSGIVVSDSSGNTIAGNVIAGWRLYGVQLAGLGELGSGDIVEGNYIGTNAAGTAALPPDVPMPLTFRVPSGIVAFSLAANTQIANNLISGLGAAVQLEGTGYRLQGNLIGTDATGTQPIPNGIGVAVLIGGNALIGGTTPGAGNTIAFNDGPAVSVNGTGVQIEGNSIYGNKDINGHTGQAIDNLSQDLGEGNPGPGVVELNWPGGPFTGTDYSTFSGLTQTETGSTLTYSGTLINGLPNTRYMVYWTLATNPND